MLPDWSQAPEWANFAAMSYGGTWVLWFEKEPHFDVDGIWREHSGQFDIFHPLGGAKESLQSRPQ